MGPEFPEVLNEHGGVHRRAAAALLLFLEVTTSDGVSYMKCSGEIPSFDGLGLDTDLSIPLGVTQPRQTLVMLHGWSQDKTFWEAGTTAGDGAGSWHWNNVWFVSKGWVVDIGHSNAQNPAWQWQPINTLAYRFLEAHVLGRKSLAPPMQTYSFQTECGGTAQPAPIGGQWDSLAGSNVKLTSTTASTTSSVDPNPADGAAGDPIANSGCLGENASTTDPGAAYYSFPSTGEHLLGLPTVQLPYTLTGQDATVAFKLWDEKPDGSKTLVTRGAYGLSTAAGDPATGTLETYLYGNDRVFPAGDTILLQVTQDDAPYLRPDNEPSVIEWSGATLDLPTRVSRGWS